eukprot:4044880-Ditylum_brightwellii.AAC.1
MGQIGIVVHPPSSSPYEHDNAQDQQQQQQQQQQDRVHIYIIPREHFIPSSAAEMDEHKKEKNGRI